MQEEDAERKQKKTPHRSKSQAIKLQQISSSAVRK